jgi:hypothetical protein
MCSYKPSKNKAAPISLLNRLGLISRIRKCLKTRRYAKTGLQLFIMIETLLTICFHEIVINTYEISG